MEEDSLADLELSYLLTDLINSSTYPPVINDRQLKNFVVFIKKNVSTRLSVTYKAKAENPNEAEFDLNKVANRFKERQRLRDSRGLEVTRERERVEAAMIEKANGCFGRVRDHLTRFDAFGKAKNLYGQASGTRKCLEMIKASGTEIPQEMIDDSCPRCPSSVPLWALMRQAELYRPEQGSPLAGHF
ncbi:hypothetical protein F2Q68_00029678 [Brassica cretica]|uniref:Uncharacterized protein n=1 Tax=Brassica cretica TaxID=69181 RepID=A0A8S9G873_BRACR|nr:hypothetical protein F2Q68_00029678 [Brassica cretica]